MNKPYTVFGNKKQGYRICVPTKAKMADAYYCVIIKKDCKITLMPGDIVYSPKVEP